MLSRNFAEMMTSTPFRDLLHAANLRHGTDGFISPPKEGVLRILSPLKIRRLRSGLNPRTNWRNISTIYTGLRWVACWPLVPKFAGSNPAEAVGFFKGEKNPQHAFLRRGSKAVGPMS